MVAVPTLSRPAQHKSQQSQNAGHETPQVNSGDGVDVHSFLEAALQIIHTSNGSFRYTLSLPWRGALRDEPKNGCEGD